MVLYLAKLNVFNTTNKDIISKKIEIMKYLIFSIITYILAHFHSQLEMSDRLKKLFEMFGTPETVQVNRPKTEGGSGLYYIRWPSGEDYQTYDLEGFLGDQERTWKSVRNGGLNHIIQDTTEEEWKFMPTWEDYNDLALWMRYLKALNAIWSRFNTPEERIDGEKESNKLKKELEGLGYKTHPEFIPVLPES